jgi:hypothetical protein
VTIFEKALDYLASKHNKTTIATILGAILVFLQGREYIASDTAQLISIILVTLGFSINIKGYINHINNPPHK